MQAAKAKLNDAYDAAVKGYVMDGKKATAKAVQAEWDDYKRATRPRRQGPRPTTASGSGPNDRYVFRSSVDNGKKVGAGSDLEMAVTKRSGKEFTAESGLTNIRSASRSRATIDNGQVKWKVTKASRMTSQIMWWATAFHGSFRGVAAGDGHQAEDTGKL